MTVTPGLRDTDWARFAGFLDGEGNFAIFSGSRKFGTSPSYMVRITLTNTNLEVLRFFQAQFGGRLSAKQRKNLRWKQGYDLRWISHKDVRPLLEGIRPYSLLKKAHVELMIAYLDEIGELPLRSGPYMEGRRQVGARYEAQYRILNQRGA